MSSRPPLHTITMMFIIKNKDIPSPKEMERLLIKLENYKWNFKITPILSFQIVLNRRQLLREYVLHFPAYRQVEHPPHLR